MPRMFYVYYKDVSDNCKKVTRSDSRDYFSWYSAYSYTCPKDYNYCVTFSAYNSHYRSRDCYTEDVTAKTYYKDSSCRGSYNDTDIDGIEYIHSCQTNNCNTVPQIKCIHNNQIAGSTLYYKDQENNGVCTDLSQGYSNSLKNSYNFDHDPQIKMDIVYSEETEVECPATPLTQYCYTAGTRKGCTINNIPPKDGEPWFETFTDEACTVGSSLMEICSGNRCNSEFEYSTELVLSLICVCIIYLCCIFGMCYCIYCCCNCSKNKSQDSINKKIKNYSSSIEKKKKKKKSSKSS